MDFSRKDCDELEDGEVLDDEHIGRASSPTAASSTERAQYQPPVSLADRAPYQAFTQHTLG